MVRRRDLLKATGAGFAALATPRLGWADRQPYAVVDQTRQIVPALAVLTAWKHLKRRRSVASPSRSLLQISRRCL